MEAELLPLQSCSWVILPCKMCLVAQHGADRAGALQGRIVEVRGPDDEARVIYDDDMEEWLALPQERFQWLAPRAQSAGGTPELQVGMHTHALRCCSAGDTMMSL